MRVETLIFSVATTARPTRPASLHPARRCDSGRQKDAGQQLAPLGKINRWPDPDPSYCRIHVGERGLECRCLIYPQESRAPTRGAAKVQSASPVVQALSMGYRFLLCMVVRGARPDVLRLYSCDGWGSELLRRRAPTARRARSGPGTPFIESPSRQGSSGCCSLGGHPTRRAGDGSSRPLC